MGFAIKNIFPFQKNFLYAIKKFFVAKFQLFCPKNLQIFSSKKVPKITQKNFSKCFFGQNAKKILTRAPAAHFKIINSGLENYEMSLKKNEKKNENYPLFLFFLSFFFCFQNFFLHEIFFILNSIIQNLYIFAIKNIFPFQKNFFICNKKIFLRRNFNFFVPKIFQFFLQKKCQKSPKKIFQSVFGQNAKKILTRAPAAHFEIINSGLENYEMSYKK